MKEQSPTLQTSEPPSALMTDRELIEHLKECRRNQRETMVRLWTALEVIRDMPLPEQDNMISANMRAVAKGVLQDGR